MLASRALRFPTSCTILIAAALTAAAGNAQAQLRASEDASIMQTVDGTEIAMRYARPRARGRTGVFGTTVHWGEVWTPGANLATTLSFSKDVTVNGNPVPEGKYSVWMVVEHGPWELVLDHDTALFHTQHPRRRAGQIRFPIQREKRPFTEVLTWSFPDVGMDGATLVMQWDTVAVPLTIEVQPSYARTTAPDVARRLVGTYRLDFEPPPPMPQDSTIETPPEDSPTTVMLTVAHVNGELRGTMDPPMYTSEPGYREWLFVPKNGGWFSLGRFQGDELAEIMDYLAIQFDDGAGPAAGFDVRMPNDMLMARGTRVR